METKKRFFVVLDNKETNKKEIKEFAFRSLAIRLDKKLTCYKVDVFSCAWIMGAIAGIGNVSWLKPTGNKELIGRNGTYSPFTIDQIFPSEESAIAFVRTGDKKLAVGKSALYDDGVSTIDVSCLTDDIRRDLIKNLPKNGRLVNLNPKPRDTEDGGLYDTYVESTGELCIRHKYVGMETYVWDGGKAVSKRINTDITDVPQEVSEVIARMPKGSNCLFYDVVSCRYFVDYNALEMKGYDSVEECEEDNQISIEYFDTQE